eukprot:Gb_39897 [translate_table: standard]
MEPPAALLQKIRSHLLEVTGSNPSPSAPARTLPTLEEVVANSGSSPFRCEKCKASFLLGPDSRICAACGTPRHEAAASFRMSFASTLAYQLLMDSFQQDVSEVILGTPRPYTERKSVRIQRTEPKDGSIAYDISSLELKWPEDESERSNMHTSKLQSANVNTPHVNGVDLEDFFGESKSQKASDVRKESVTSIDQTRDVEYHAPANVVAQSSANESYVDLFSSQLGRQETHVNTEDNDPFLSWENDIKIANAAIKTVGSESADSGGDPLYLTETTKATGLASNSQSTYNGRDLFGDSMNDVKHTISTQENWIQDDPWSAVMTKESCAENSKNLKENSGSQSNCQEANHWTNRVSKSEQKEEIGLTPDSVDLFLGSTWQQGDIVQHHKSTAGMNEDHKAGEIGVTELGSLFQSYPSHGLKVEKEAASANTTISGFDLFNRIEDKEANGQSKSNVAALGANRLNTTVSHVSSNGNSKEVVESLLSQMHDLSFMLADHLVIPNGDREF